MFNGSVSPDVEPPRSIENPAPRMNDSSPSLQAGHRHQRPSKSDWKLLRAKIIDLYINEALTLRDIGNMIQREFGLYFRYFLAEEYLQWHER